MKDHKIFTFWSLNILIPLFSGLILYLLFRSDTYVSQFIYGIFAIPKNAAILCGDSRFFKFIRFYACDILWAYSLTFLLSLIIGHKSIQNIIVFIIALSFDGTIEFLQKFDIIPGTFDIIDILLEAVITVFALLIIIHKFNHHTRGKSK